MTVDLIIPVYKPKEKFGKCLKRMEEQTIKPNRVILMNTGKEWFDERLIEGISNVEVYHITKEEFDHGGTRGIAAAKSTADLLLFMTDDAIPANRHLVEQLIKPFAEEDVAAVYGRQMADEKKSPIEAYTRTFNYPQVSRKKSLADLEELGIKAFFCSNVCAMYRRSDYEAMGGFIRKTIFNEDMIMASQLLEHGKAIYYAADAKVWHWHEYGAREQLHRNFDLAVSQQDAGGLFRKVKSESEGIRLVKATMGHLWQTGKVRYIPRLIVQSGFKYVGYQLGSHYRKLPMWLILKLTMNRSYWK